MMKATTKNKSHNESRKPWKASEAPVLGRHTVPGMNRLKVCHEPVLMSAARLAVGSDTNGHISAGSVTNRD